MQFALVIMRCDKEEKDRIENVGLPNNILVLPMSGSFFYHEHHHSLTITFDICKTLQ